MVPLVEQVLQGGAREDAQARLLQPLLQPAQRALACKPSPRTLCDPASSCLAAGAVVACGLRRFAQVLEQLTGQTPVFSKARYTVRTFGIRRNEKIACHVTVSGEKALNLIVRAARGAAGRPAPRRRLAEWAWRALAKCLSGFLLTYSPAGVGPEGEGVRAAAPQLQRDGQLRCARRHRLRYFALLLTPSPLVFGINEHIDLGLKYDPSTGIYGAISGPAAALEFLLHWHN